MQPKPSFLGPQNAASFEDERVAKAYDYRPPYPDAVFDILTSLILDQPHRVLDIGCGTGFVARRLVEKVAHIDAVDISPVMIEQGKSLPHGDSASLSWIIGPIESVSLNPPYALITAGDSLHWMDWGVVLPRFAEMLTPNGYLAIFGVGQLATPWDDVLMPVIQQYSTAIGYQPYDLVAELEMRGLFWTAGRQTTNPVSFTQSLNAYIESFHGRASFSRARMGDDAARAFDAEIRALVSRHSPDNITLQSMTEVVWGKPLQPGEYAAST